MGLYDTAHTYTICFCTKYNSCGFDPFSFKGDKNVLLELGAIRDTIYGWVEAVKGTFGVVRMYYLQKK